MKKKRKKSARSNTICVSLVLKAVELRPFQLYPGISICFYVFLWAFYWFLAFFKYTTCTMCIRRFCYKLVLYLFMFFLLVCSSYAASHHLLSHPPPKKKTFGIPTISNLAPGSVHCTLHVCCQFLFPACHSSFPYVLSEWFSCREVPDVIIC